MQYVDSASSLAGVEHVCKRLRERFPGPALARIAHWDFARDPVLLDRHAIEFN